MVGGEGVNEAYIDKEPRVVSSSSTLGTVKTEGEWDTEWSRLTDMKGNNAYLKEGRAMGRSAGEVRAVAYGLFLC